MRNDRRKNLSLRERGAGPDVPGSFFIEDLVPSLIGEEVHDVTAHARRFISPEIFEHAAGIRDAFHDGGRVRHVVLSNVLRASTARSIGRALDDATFRRHHHVPYRIDVAPLESLAASRLLDFCAWLGTDDAARFHGWLANWPARHAKQVQVARARRGDEFAVHVDTHQEGLAAVYNFTRGFSGADGGALYFPWKEHIELLVPPRFNTLALFRPRNAPHGVTRITAPRGKTRFTVTAFFTA